MQIVQDGQAPSEASGSKVPLEQKYLQERVKGTLQNRASALANALRELNQGNDAELIDTVARSGRHVAQLEYEIRTRGGLPWINEEAAIPAFGPASRRAREINAKTIEGHAASLDPTRAKTFL